jgi:hypothetical protein
MPVLALVILMFSVGGRLLWNRGVHAAIVALSLVDRRWSMVVRRWSLAKLVRKPGQQTLIADDNDLG